MRVLGIDFETTIDAQFNTEVMRIAEVGAVLWDTETRTPLLMYSTLVWSESHQFDPLMKRITNLDEKEFSTFGIPPHVAVAEIRRLWELSDKIFVAHNGLAFDKRILWAEQNRIEILDNEWCQGSTWVDTKIDIEYPEKIETRKLDFLAPQHGFLNPFAHRALFDTLTMLKVMGAYPFEPILASARQPLLELAFDGQPPWKDGGRDNAFAKSLGFMYDPEDKRWKIKLREAKAQKMKQENPDRKFFLLAKTP